MYNFDSYNVLLSIATNIPVTYDWVTHHPSLLKPRSLTQPRVSSDIPVHPEPVLPLARGAAGNAVRSGHRHVVSGLYPGGDAHRRASVQRR